MFLFKSAEKVATMNILTRVSVTSWVNCSGLTLTCLPFCLGNAEDQQGHCWRLLLGWSRYDLVAGEWVRYKFPACVYLRVNKEDIGSADSFLMCIGCLLAGVSS